MTLVTEQAKVCQRLVPPGRARLSRAAASCSSDPTCRTAREVLRLAPTASAAPTPPDGDPGRRQRGARPSTARPGEGRAAPGGRGDLDRGARARGRGRLRGRPAARPVRPARAPDRGSRRATSRRSSTASWRAGCRRSRASARRLCATLHRRDRRHRPVRRRSTSCSPTPASTRPSAARAARAPTPRRAWHMSQGRQRPPPRRRLPDRRRRHPAQPGHRRPLRAASAPPARAR